jgi:hypothetical protein
MSSWCRYRQQFLMRYSRRSWCRSRQKFLVQAGVPAAGTGAVPDVGSNRQVQVQAAGVLVQVWTEFLVQVQAGVLCGSTGVSSWGQYRRKFLVQVQAGLPGAGTDRSSR